MKKRVIFFYNYLKDRRESKLIQFGDVRTYLLNRKGFLQNPIQSAESINKEMYNMILSGTPFFIGRFGATELFGVRTFDFELTMRYEKALSQMKMWSGFFPPTVECGKKFKDLMIDCIPEVDIIGIWKLPFESYYLKQYGKKELRKTYLLDLEPWCVPEKPWSAALKGKKVLVIHPFARTIEAQYKQRSNLFPHTDILPEFDLKTLKAVQTIAGERDNRFDTWFDALEWMYKESMKINFDIALIGCGAYGFPLAAKIKKSGKQAIHLGGATQLLFGIKGKRWEENPQFTYVQKFFNDAWVYPDDTEKPKRAEKVEGGCYW